MLGGLGVADSVNEKCSTRSLLFCVQVWLLQQLTDYCVMLTGRLLPWVKRVARMLVSILLITLWLFIFIWVLINYVDGLIVKILYIDACILACPNLLILPTIVEACDPYVIICLLRLFSLKNYKIVTICYPLGQVSGEVAFTEYFPIPTMSSSPS